MWNVFLNIFNNAPIIEVSGRTYPVEVRYRPIVEDESRSATSILNAVDELQAEGRGDILILMNGERIRDTAEALQKQNLKQHGNSTALCTSFCARTE